MPKHVLAVIPESEYDILNNKKFRYHIENDQTIRFGLIMRKPFFFCICENKDADQLRGNREADQRLCFRYTDSKIPALPNPKFQASSHLL